MLFKPQALSESLKYAGNVVPRPTRMFSKSMSYLAKSSRGVATIIINHFPKAIPPCFLGNNNLNIYVLKTLLHFSAKETNCIQLKYPFWDHERASANRSHVQSIGQARSWYWPNIICLINIHESYWQELWWVRFCATEMLTEANDYLYGNACNQWWMILKKTYYQVKSHASNETGHNK